MAIETYILRIETIHCASCKGEKTTPVRINEPHGPWGECRQCNGLGLEELETEITIQGYYMPDTPSYFDRSFGNYLPGDPAEVEITSATDLDGNKIILTEREEAEALQAIIDAQASF